MRQRRPRKPSAFAPSLPAVAVCVALLLLCGPHAAGAQTSTWTRVGGIGATAMYMDTASIARQGHARRVWLMSVDPAPARVVLGADTIRFDTVVALHLFDCRAGTYAILSARYLMGADPVLPPRPADANPRPLRSGSFLSAVARDLCRS